MMPFAYRQQRQESLYETIKRQGYDFFSLDQLQKEVAYYGDVRISHENLDQYFLPHIERRIFPKHERADAFLRFSKVMNTEATLHIHAKQYTFRVLSVDIVLCPFQLGFITCRLQLTKRYTLNDMIDFMHHIRILEPKMALEFGMTIHAGKMVYESVNDYTFKQLCPFLQPFIHHDAVRGGYFGSLPFFEDERMLISACFQVDEPMQTIDCYRLSQLDGYDADGEPYVSAYNEAYMKTYLNKRMYNRFSPHIEKIMTEHVYMSVLQPSATKQIRERAAIHFMGIEYYQLLLHYFYKLTLMKLSYLYSEVSVLHDQDYTEKLITYIDQFSASYYFQEVSSRSSGMEFAEHLQRIFNIEQQYNEVKETLETLYRNQESTATRRQNNLLFMLTIFTVVSGIYGMNLVIEAWGDGYKWSALKNYTLFEWIAYITAIAGISLSIIVISISAYRTLNTKRKKWQHKKYE